MSKSLWLKSIILAATLIGAAGCNTVRGLGEDINSAGRGLQNAADSVEADFREGVRSSAEPAPIEQGSAAMTREYVEPGQSDELAGGPHSRTECPTGGDSELLGGSGETAC